jgi:hypothetical protein
MLVRDFFVEKERAHFIEQNRPDPNDPSCSVSQLSQSMN